MPFCLGSRPSHTCSFQHDLYPKMEQRTMAHVLLLFSSWAPATLTSAGILCASQREQVHDVKPGRQADDYHLLLFLEVAKSSVRD
jgi:hypothetical protein